MKFIFTNHAKCRLNERNISIDLVKKVILNADGRKVDEYGMITARKSVGNKKLEIVYKIKHNVHIIITAYYEN